MGISVITAATHEPVTLEEMHWQLRVDTSDEDSLLDSLVKAAREYCEVFTSRQFISTTYDQTFDVWADKLILPHPPLSSVTTVKYYDADGVEQTLDSGTYEVVTNVEPGFVRLAYDESWPTHRSQNEAITVRFVAGYGDAGDVPDTLKHAVKMLASHFYEHRESVALLDRGQTLAEMPMAVRSLLWSKRIYEVA